jgi:hypothetical protein
VGRAFSLQPAFSGIAEESEKVFRLPDAAS